MTRPGNNPKSVFGTAKPGISGIPPVALLHCGRGMEDGVIKYGLTNWRENSVSAGVYYNAAFRHLGSWWDGEQEAPDSGVHHLGHVMACCAILLDAEACGNLVDDRPSVPGTFAAMVKAMTHPMEDATECCVEAPEAMTAPYDMEALNDLTEGDIEELALRVMSVNDLDSAKDIIRAFMTDEEPEKDAPRVEAGWDLASGEAAETGVGFWSPDGQAHAVVLREGITASALEAQIREFLEGDAERKQIAQFNSFRSHIGSFHVASYSQRNRTRLAFYIEAARSGVALGVFELDEALRAAGFVFGAS